MQFYTTSFFTFFKTLIFIWNVLYALYFHEPMERSIYILEHNFCLPNNSLNTIARIMYSRANTLNNAWISMYLLNKHFLPLYLDITWTQTIMFLLILVNTKEVFDYSTPSKAAPDIIKFSKPLTSATFTLHRVFYCVARTWVVIGCQRDLLLLGRLFWMSLRRTRCKLRLPRDALVKGLLNFIIVGLIRNQSA